VAPGDDLLDKSWLYHLSDSDYGVAFLLQHYRDAAESPEALLYDLADAVDGAHLVSWLQDEPERKKRRRRFKHLGAAWGCDLSDLHRVNTASDAARALADTLATLPADPEVDALWKREALLKLSQDRRCLEAIAEAAAVRVSRLSHPDPVETSFLLACTLAARRDDRCREWVASAVDLDAVWHVLTLRAWRGEPGPGLLTFLRGFEPEAILQTLKPALDRDIAQVDYAIRILQALSLPGRVEFFIDLLLEDSTHEAFGDRARRALRAVGPEAIDALVARYQQDLPEPVHLIALAETPTLEVEGFLMVHFDHYMRDAWSEMYIDALEVAGSHQGLEPLLAEWQPGEIHIARAIAHLAQLYDVQDGRLDPIVAEAEAHRQQVLKPLEETPETALSRMLDDTQPLRLPLRCTQCGRTYHYELKRVFVDPKHTERVTVGEIIECKGCGSLETYEVSPRSRMQITAELMRLMLKTRFNPSAEPIDPQDLYDQSRVIPQQITVEAGGRRFKTLSEGYWYVRQQLDKDPTNGDLNRRMGLILKNGSRPDLAMPYLVRAVTLTPKDAEAHYHLMELLVQQDRAEDAIPHAETLLRLCREGHVDEDLNEGMFGHMLHQLAHIEDQTGRRFKVYQPRDEQAVIPDFDLEDPDDYERAYHLFRTGEMQARNSQRGWRSAWRGADTSTVAPSQVMEDDLLEMPVRTRHLKVGRNEPCPCGSGKKYKRCCGR
jgi:tetratricopeptide (TPR) repeat protein